MHRKKLISTGILVLTLAIGSSFTVFATSESDSTSTAEVQTQQLRKNKIQMTEEQRTAIENARKASIKEAAAAMVSNGTITQDEADSLIANLYKVQEKPSNAARIKGQGRGSEIFSSLTDAQQESVKSEVQAVYELSLAKLVDNNTITQEQADQLKSMQGKKTKLDITETQRDAVKEAKLNSIKTAIANLTANGTLSQSDADAISNSIASKTADNTNKGNGIFANLTDEQVTAIKDAASVSYKNALTDLVSNGTITQEIADKVQNMNFGHGPRVKGYGQKNTESNETTDSTETSAESI